LLLQIIGDDESYAWDALRTQAWVEEHFAAGAGEPLYARALDAEKRTLTENDPNYIRDLAIDLERQADREVKAHQPARAAELQRQATGQWERAYGKTSRQFFKSQDRVAYMERLARLPVEGQSLLIETNELE